jgi:hypothetical protein
MSKLTPQTREKLKSISTATLTSILFKRGLIAKLAMPSYHHRPSAPTNLTVHQALPRTLPTRSRRRASR